MAPEEFPTITPFASACFLDVMSQGTNSFRYNSVRGATRMFAPGSDANFSQGIFPSLRGRVYVAKSYRWPPCTREFLCDDVRNQRSYRHRYVQGSLEWSATAKTLRRTPSASLRSFPVKVTKMAVKSGFAQNGFCGATSKRSCHVHRHRTGHDAETCALARDCSATAEMLHGTPPRCRVNNWRPPS